MSRDRNLRVRMYPYYELFVHHYFENDMVWDLLWHWKIHSKKRIGLFPSTSLIWCSGFSEGATHTGSVPKGYQNSLERVMKRPSKKEIVFPTYILSNDDAVFELQKFLRSMYASPLRMYYRWGRDKVKSYINGHFHI
jgi:hypothetical protein